MIVRAIDIVCTYERKNTSELQNRNSVGARLNLATCASHIRPSDVGRKTGFGQSPEGK
ncbi:hypothetical protein BABINDRAFT_159668 [Babjeviella inositovora NRRL Y-12698]|uniref:Uncharacterized protein n=1 Tax=Babjeviella inositovora NRRL Y-12698 TaxID=984486 RepID=A0A1E3QZW6_9ASCO|nr:uncharacterized protein BABINDRAFT_159668 [Babjeviella inositovora NRRL Y-12698]ODQ83230.1 hypothetical protein BABINDRAFT_159668 [Babjeviella inositovora NRRL Y-12698]